MHGALDRLRRDGALPPGLDLARVARRAAARPGARRGRDQRRPGAGEGRRQAADGRWPSDLPRALAGRAGGGRRRRSPPRLCQPAPWRPPSGSGRCARCCGRAPAMAAAAWARGTTVNVEYLLRQPDGAAARRPRPRHGVRRRAGQPAGVCRLRCDPANIMSTTAGRRSRRWPARSHLRYREALGEDDRRRCPRASTRATTSSRWRGDRRARRRALAGRAARPMAASLRARRRRGDAAADPRRPGGARRLPRRLHPRARPDRERRHRARRSPTSTPWGSSTPARCRRPRASRSTTGSRSRSSCSARPPLATRSTARSSARTGPGPTSPPTSPITCDKIRRGFPLMVDVWGADHGGYVKRMQAAVRGAHRTGRATLDIRLCQLVNLLDAGRPLKMSKRAGRIVTLRDVVDEVGARRRPLHHADPQERRAARLRPRQGDGAVEGQPGLLRPVRPRPHLLGVAPRGRRTATTRPTSPPRGRSRSERLSTRPSCRCCASRRRFRGRSRVRPGRSSHTGSPFISTSSPALPCLVDTGKEDQALRFLHEHDVDADAARARDAAAVRLRDRAGLS